MSDTNQMAVVPDEGPLPIRKQPFDDPYFDLTAMIDLVFMMNIFFLVTSIASAISELDLPPARHVHAAELEKAIIVSIVSAGDGVPPTVRLEDASGAQTLPAGSQQEERIRAAIEAGMADGSKSLLLIKAERAILHRDVARIASVAAGFQGLKLNLAVLEFDTGP